VLFLCYLAIYLLRALLYPRYVAQQLANDIMETACLASISIVFTTIIQMIALTLPSTWGHGWGMLAYVLWWCNMVLALTAVVGIPYVFTRLESPGTDSVPPAVMLPVIAALTIAAGGGVVCRYGALSPALQVPVIIISYMFVGIGLPLAVMFGSIFFTRIFDQSFPIKQKVCSHPAHPHASVLEPSNRHAIPGLPAHDLSWTAWPRKLRFADPG